MHMNLESLRGRHLIDPEDLTMEELNQLLDLGIRMEEDPQAFADCGRGKNFRHFVL